MDTQTTVAVNPQDNLTTKGGLRVPYFDNPHLNDPRVARAEEIYISYEREHGEEGAPVRNLAELLCDFALLCDCNDHQLADALKIAAKLYSEETERGRQFSA